MKRFFSFLVLAILFAGCDDGDLQEVSFEFDTTAAKACNKDESDFYLYKTTDKRALIIQIPEDSLINEVTLDEPRTIEISSTNQLIYRVYSGEVSDNTICSDFPAASPVVVEERIADGGTILITTTAIKNDIQTDGSTEITGYLHTINFIDVTFDIGDGVQRNESIAAVTYRTDPIDFEDFNELTGVESCSNTSLYKFSESQGLTLKLSEASAATLFSNVEGIKTQLFNTENILTHLFFDTEINPLTGAYFCATETPELPEVVDTWTAANGVEGVSGIIEVETVAIDATFKHTIILRDVKMIKGTLNFLLPSEYVFGEYITE